MLFRSYNAGRGVRKQLRLANEEVMRALDLYGAVIVRWKRSVGDFRSAVELRTDDRDAAFNADVVQRHIDELQKHMKELAEKKEQLGKTRGNLKKKLAELRKKIPDGRMQPGQGEDDEDDEDEPKVPQKPDSGFKDEQKPAGEKRGITPEMAQQILEALGLKGDRKLPIGPDGKMPGGDEKTRVPVGCSSATRIYRSTGSRFGRRPAPSKCSSIGSKGSPTTSFAHRSITNCPCSGTDSLF